MFTQIAKSICVNSLAVVVLVLGTGVCLAQSHSQKSALGELRIEGENIERLLLRRNDGHREVLNNPEETVRLPTGQYILNEIRLKGGYNHRSMPRKSRVTIRDDKPAVLKVGGPLKQTISVQRQGKILRLTYGLVGIGGETYTVVRNVRKRPGFSIYKGDREIANGKFEFG